MEMSSSYRLTHDNQVHGSVHGSVSVVADAGVDSLLCGYHVIQGEREVGGRVPQQLLVSKHPGDLGRRITVHLTVQHHWAALHHLWGDVHPHWAWRVWEEEEGIHSNINASSQHIMGDWHLLLECLRIYVYMDPQAWPCQLCSSAHCSRVPQHLIAEFVINSISQSW